jgi:hypothetical protein
MRRVASATITSHNPIRDKRERERTEDIQTGEFFRFEMSLLDFDLTARSCFSPHRFLFNLFT